MKKIYIASDHAGFNLKESIKKKFSSKFEVLDLGPKHSKKSVNYPDYAHKLSKKIKKENIGILVCGSGMGMAMTANKHKGVRAAICWSEEIAELAREHNDANIISIPSRFLSEEKIINIVEAFIKTDFEGGRHKRRIEKIDGND